MSKKSDLKFTPDVETFLKNHPHLAMNKPVANTGAIRAILRGGQKLEGVELVEEVSVPQEHTKTGLPFIKHEKAQ